MYIQLETITRFQVNSAFLVFILLCISSITLAGDNETETHTDRSAQVDRIFEDFTHGVQPGAAVMVILDGEVVHSRGYGYANLVEETPITPASTFRLGSVSKQFTAMAIAILADKGELDYSDQISQHVPVLSAYEGVTIRHLLTHTSGLPDYYDEFDASEWTERGMLPANIDVMTYEGSMDGPLFPPGEKYVYSNPAYEALPLVVEAVSGQDFATFMRDRLFRPSGMSGSLIHDHKRPQIERRVLGYSGESGVYTLYDDDPLNGIVGSGGQYSTLKDFYHWNQVIENEELVSPETWKEILTRARLNSGEAIDYGFGWRLDSYRGYDRMAHGGSWVGFRTAITRYSTAGLTIIILSNRAEYDPVAASDRVSDIYLVKRPWSVVSSGSSLGE